MKTKINIIGTEYAILEQFKTEEPLSAVEVLEVLVNEYATGKYNEIFGYNPYYSELTRRFTPAEIVQKVTEWKRKQNKQIRVAKVLNVIGINADWINAGTKRDNKTQVTEDMIADALDEKYGIGNWGRK